MIEPYIVTLPDGRQVEFHNYDFTPAWSGSRQCQPEPPEASLDEAWWAGTSTMLTDAELTELHEGEAYETLVAAVAAIYEREESETELGDETVVVRSVKPSTTIDVEGAVDAEVTVRIDDQIIITADVTFAPNLGRPSLGRRHPLDACGSPLDWWAGDPLYAALRDVDADERRRVQDEIEAAVDEAARAVGL